MLLLERTWFRYIPTDMAVIFPSDAGIVLYHLHYSRMTTIHNGSSFPVSLRDVVLLSSEELYPRSTNTKYHAAPCLPVDTLQLLLLYHLIPLCSVKYTVGLVYYLFIYLNNYK
jgi:hypothetical protein